MPVTIQTVGKKTRDLANILYDGDMYGHVSEIYNLLTEEEKKIFLNTSITTLISNAETCKEEEKCVDGATERDMRIHMEIAELAAIDELEMLELKKWLFKAVVIAVLIVLGIAVLGTVFHAAVSNGVKSVFKEFFHLFRTMFFL